MTWNVTFSEISSSGSWKTLSELSCFDWPSSFRSFPSFSLSFLSFFLSSDLAQRATVNTRMMNKLVNPVKRAAKSILSKKIFLVENIKNLFEFHSKSLIHSEKLYFLRMVNFFHVNCYFFVTFLNSMIIQ
ncbi:hypothetical protein TRFO_39553 [Tritrichomonas foetus]|uniref:Uncharacterized protein n=1 Tax=Tritrichomonas foetus TaxID=1144522 RepID=A0A1J4JAG9_9EUKA|nr:hypothetical protein TRFO_39553 [Tritrichomonas foetus]|eukprot:OHS94260.1 hypothetical protein TRFO_39553 [Tritrichomonas foetus]